MIDGQQTTQLVLPVHYRSIVLKLLHDDSGHQGRDQTISLVRSRFFWPGLDSDVKKKVKTCDRCIMRKSNPGPSAELVNIVSSQPMELVCIDFLTLERYWYLPIISPDMHRLSQLEMSWLRLQPKFSSIILSCTMVSLLAFIAIREETLKVVL